ncbi:carboxypeptidase-like regulatory domain-containing protein, partial [Bacteroidales bacterium OttesenSCG-928-B11]|nr:carboxypeptidase-like regulatory domain-containing protein [Bacteroidales bacterium OttesenSCG-928-B11]
MRYIVGLFLLLLLVFELPAQNKVQVFGFVSDNNSGEKLIGATVYDTIAQKGAITDNSGYFSLLVSESACLRVDYFGYTTTFIPLKNNKKDTLLNIKLEIASYQLNEVVVTAKRETKPNVVGLSSQDMAYMPSLGSKPDVMRQLQSLPGISMQSESSSSLLVRGGDPGQNLYLIDNIPLIYVNHLGGFFSVFNPDIINHIDVYKGGFPARFGGRISSIIDISQKKGDRSCWKGNFSAGITDLSFAVEGPCSKNTSLIITGRKTLIDPLLLLFSSISDGGDYQFFYGFHDINAKFSWEINKKNSMTFNFYHGDDYFGTTYKNLIINDKNETAKIRNTWGNILLSARWNNIVSSKLFANHSLSFTRYRLNQKSSLSDGDTLIKHGYLNSLQDLSLKTD